MAGADNIFLGFGTVYLAPLGTTFPAVDTAPDAAWFQVGTDGAKSYAESGITLRRNVSTAEIRALGTTLIRKAAITDADFEVEFTVIDMAPEQLLLALGGLETGVTDVEPGVGVPGSSAITVPTSPTPVRKAVLLRIPMSVAGAQFNTDVRIQDAIQVGGGEATISKGDAMQWQHVWKVLEPAAGDAVVIIAQTAVATPE